MFWTDWGLKTVQRATLNGENIKVLINDSLNFVNGLTIDYKNERIYWVDAAFDKIESSTLEGDDRKEVKVNGMWKFTQCTQPYEDCIHIAFSQLLKSLE
jgi:hypothetical protein